MKVANTEIVHQTKHEKYAVWGFYSFSTTLYIFVVMMCSIRGAQEPMATWYISENWQFWLVQHRSVNCVLICGQIWPELYCEHRTGQVRSLISAL